MLSTIFLGTPDFSIPSLKALIESPEINLVSVITMPDRPVGRGKKLTSPPIAQFAKKNNLSLFQTQNINKEIDFIKDLEQREIDLIIVVAFAQFLGKRILNLPRLGCFNIHTSLLPKYRGAAPIQYALLNGDKVTGVSIQKMVKEMDAGDLVISKEISISDNCTGGELFDLLKIEAASSLLNFIQLAKDKNIILTPQTKENISFAPTIKKEDGLLSFDKETNENLINKVRAFSPWPGTFLYLNDLRLKVIEVKKDPKKIEIGKTSIDFGTLLIGCREGSLRLTKVQLEGKKPCSDADLINGLKNKYKEFSVTTTRKIL